jgi:hypothetical protein
MTLRAGKPSREDVLDAFAVEATSRRETLERYLREYPQYAADLIDLSRELARVTVERTGPLSADEEAMVKGSWETYLAAASAPVEDPFGMLSVTEWREIAKRLDLPRQIIAAFRERRVVVESVPQRVFVSFASVMNTTVEMIVKTLALPPPPELARSYKAESKPQAAPPVTFEQLLIDAGVPDEKRALLMADD